MTGGREMQKRFVLVASVFFLTQAGLLPTSITADELDCLIEPSQVVNVSSPAEGVLDKV